MLAQNVSLGSYKNISTSTPYLSKLSSLQKRDNDRYQFSEPSSLALPAA